MKSVNLNKEKMSQGAELVSHELGRRWKYLKRIKRAKRQET